MSPRVVRPIRSVEYPFSRAPGIHVWRDGVDGNWGVLRAFSRQLGNILSPGRQRDVAVVACARRRDGAC
jgi:hypothetical protein